MVTEALLLNGPGAGKIVSVLWGEHTYVWDRDEAPIIYRVDRHTIRRIPRRESAGLDVYRVGWIDNAPEDEEIDRLIREKGFQPYYHYVPNRR